MGALWGPEENGAAPVLRKACVVTGTPRVLRRAVHTHYFRDTPLTEFKSKHISSLLTLSQEDKLCKPEDWERRLWLVLEDLATLLPSPNTRGNLPV